MGGDILDVERQDLGSSSIKALLKRNLGGTGKEQAEKRKSHKSLTLEPGQGSTLRKAAV